MSSFSTFGFLNPFVQSRWKERAAKADAEQKARRKRDASAIETETAKTEGLGPKGGDDDLVSD